MNWKTRLGLAAACLAALLLSIAAVLCALAAMPR